MTGFKSLLVPLGFNEKRENYFSILYLHSLWPMTVARGGGQRVDPRTNLPMWRARVIWQPLDYREKYAIGGPYRNFQEKPVPLLVTIFGWGGRNQQVDVEVFNASKMLAEARKANDGTEPPPVRIELVDPELYIGEDNRSKRRDRGKDNRESEDTESGVTVRFSAYGIKLWKPPEETVDPDEAAADSGHDDVVSDDTSAATIVSGLEVIEASDLLATPCE